MADKIKIQILEDGTLSIETDSISGQNHMSADEFLKQIEKLTGKTTEEHHKAGYSTHTHSNGITHSH
jgi:hypothetical protein